MKCYNGIISVCLRIILCALIHTNKGQVEGFEDSGGSRRALVGVAYWWIGMDSKSIVKRTKKIKDKRIMIQG